MLYIYKCGVIYTYYYSRVWSINSSLTLTHTLKEYDEKVEYTPHCNDVLNKQNEPPMLKVDFENKWVLMDM